MQSSHLHHQYNKQMHSRPRFHFAWSFLLAGMMSIIMGCGINPLEHPIGEGGVTGDVDVSISLGSVAVLGKSLAAHDIDLSVVRLRLSAKGETDLVDSIGVSGHEKQTVTAKFFALAAQKEWTLTVTSEDKAGKIIHQGKKTFAVQPDVCTKVSVSLDAMYSMLKAKFFPVPDEATRCVVSIDHVERASDAGPFAADTGYVEYDYLTTGAAHTIRLDVRGLVDGFDTVLYSADTALFVVAGKTVHVSMRLQWVGPVNAARNAAAISVEVGTIGTVLINGGIDTSGHFQTEECIDDYCIVRKILDDAGWNDIHVEDVCYFKNSRAKSLYLDYHRGIPGKPLKRLSADVGRLDALEQLSLSGNDLDRLPPEIGNLKNLDNLEISSNPRLTVLPAQIGGLTELTSFRAQYCSLKELPVEIGRLVSLKYLYLDFNDLTDIPSGLTELAAHVTVAGNRLCGITDPVKVVWLSKGGWLGTGAGKGWNEAQQCGPRKDGEINFYTYYTLHGTAGSGASYSANAITSFSDPYRARDAQDWVPSLSFGTSKFRLGTATVSEAPESLFHDAPCGFIKGYTLAITPQMRAVTIWGSIHIPAEKLLSYGMAANDVYLLVTDANGSKAKVTPEKTSGQDLEFFFVWGEGAVPDTVRIALCEHGRDCK